MKNIWDLLYLVWCLEGCEEPDLGENEDKL